MLDYADRFAAHLGGCLALPSCVWNHQTFHSVFLPTLVRHQDLSNCHKYLHGGRGGMDASGHDSTHDELSPPAFY